MHLRISSYETLGHLTFMSWWIISRIKTRKKIGSGSNISALSDLNVLINFKLWGSGEKEREICRWIIVAPAVRVYSSRKELFCIFLNDEGISWHFLIRWTNMNIFLILEHQGAAGSIQKQMGGRRGHVWCVCMCVCTYMCVYVGGRFLSLGLVLIC